MDAGQRTETARMSARNPPKPGWVTVVDAAAALTAGGDPIDASNVSRYLARNPDIPSSKAGKFRFVDLQALKAHRSTSLYVADKRVARDLEDFIPTPAAAEPARPADYDDDTPEKPGSPLTAGKIELQQIELRRKRREEEVEAGNLVPVEDLQAVVSAMIGAFVGELARQEQALLNKYGREVGLAVRQAHRAARAAATRQLITAANEQLHPAAATSVTNGETGAVAVA